jgi:voltage-gated potassium channel
VVFFTDPYGLSGGGVGSAACIIIDNPSDEITMATALYCAKVNPFAHLIAYFQNDRLGRLLKEHCPNIEVMPSVSIEMIAKAAADPGSSGLHHELLADDDGMTQYSALLPCKESFSFNELMMEMKFKCDAILIGASGECGSIKINPAGDQTLVNGQKIYYIAEQRLTKEQWDKICANNC